jgi:hypothetical protein
LNITEKLTAHYKNELAKNFKIKITNPSGLIIMGRTVGLSEEQIQDFEVIKRTYLCYLYPSSSKGSAPYSVGKFEALQKTQNFTS